MPPTQILLKLLGKLVPQAEREEHGTTHIQSVVVGLITTQLKEEQVVLVQELIYLNLTMGLLEPEL